VIERERAIIDEHQQLIKDGQLEIARLARLAPRNTRKRA
jgi:hypothetical protein